MNEQEARQLTVLSNVMVEALNAYQMESTEEVNPGVVIASVVCVLASVIGGSSETRDDAWKRVAISVEMLTRAVETVALKDEMLQRIEAMRASAT